MGTKWVIGACMLLASAAPVFGAEGFGAEGIGAARVKVAKFVEESPPLLKKQDEIPPQVKVSESYQYYDVDGSTAEELRAQMRKNGTTWNDGKVYAALTTWDIRYHYNIGSADGRYSLNSIKAEVDIVFHLPRLAPSPKTSQELTSSWDLYMANLKTHEFGHRKIAVDIGREIYQELSALGSSASKEQLDEQAQGLVKAEFKKLKEAQIDYDADTHHGIKQGAVLVEPTLASTGRHPE